MCALSLHNIYTMYANCMQYVCTLSAKYMQIVCILYALPTSCHNQDQELGGDPPEPDLGLHWDDREPCPFSKEEGEAFRT
jgi:hypothetical protein